MSDNVLDQLRGIVGAERVSVTQADRDAHGGDESHHPPRPPDWVVWPDTPEEVARVLVCANERRIPVTARSGGTSLDGNPIPLRGGIVLAMHGWDRLIDVRPRDLACTVQPGINYDHLNKQLARHGLFFPPAPGSHEVATIGGMVSNNSGGMHALRYGVTRDYVLRLQVVLVDGRILTLGTSAAKSSSGYDLVRLFVGSEGTLGIVTEVTLKLRAIPEKSAAIAVFPSVQAAAQAASEIIGAGLVPAAMELMDSETVGMVNRYCGLSLPEHPMLVMEFHGTAAGVREEVALVQEITAGSGSTGYLPAATTEERERLWKGRSEAHNAVKQLNLDCQVIIGDVVVPISRYPDAVAMAYQLGKRHGVRVCTFGHAGDGNIHTETIARKASTVELEGAQQVHGGLMRWAISVGGTATGEHGIGLGKRAFLEVEHGAAVGLMRQVKALLDPNGILNPGKIFPD